MQKKTTQARKHKRNASNRFLSKLEYHGENNLDTIVDLIQYDQKDFRLGRIDSDVDFRKRVDKGMVNWFKVIGISNVSKINTLCKEFGLHGFDIKNLLSADQAVKVAVYDDFSFILMPLFVFDSGRLLTTSHLGFILGKDFIVTIQESGEPIFDDIILFLEDDFSQLRQNKSDFLLYVLLNYVNTLYMSVIIKMEDQLLEIEDQLLEMQNSSSILYVLRTRRLDLIKMKRAMMSLREEFADIQHDMNNLIDEKNRAYFNDFDDKVRSDISNLETCRELMHSLLDLYFNNTNTRMNEIMKRLTLVATIFIPLTFLVGVWGMNFKYMPELESQYGYLLAWIIFISVAVGLFFFLKKKKWF